MLYTIVPISIGASVGAILRWLLGLALNTVFPTIPLGTLIANLLGGYLIGLSISVLSAYPLIGIEWRLFIITGFLGSLTTFSAFSAEVTTLLQQEQFLWATGAIALHVCGSLAMTFLGMASFHFVKHLYN